MFLHRPGEIFGMCALRQTLSSDWDTFFSSFSTSFGLSVLTVKIRISKLFPILSIPYRPRRPTLLVIKSSISTYQTIRRAGR
jgi:hypothetical protein